MDRTIFYISDGTGITAETIGHSLMTQFEGVRFKRARIPFVDSEDKALDAADQINKAAQQDGTRPIVINTVVDQHLCDILADSDGFILDLFATFLGRLEDELEVKRSPRVGQAHGMVDHRAYEARINATNYALAHDDGVKPRYDDADMVLIGVSRSGKTPTCLYLALQYGVAAANYPLTEEDLERHGLPELLAPHRDKLFGLTIDPVRLAQIRQMRRPDSSYADLRQCRREVADAESMFRLNGISFLNTTHTSIEEIASKVMLSLGLKRDMF